MPCWVLLLNVVGACPLVTVMLTRPPATLRPSRRLSAVPAPVTVTPCAIDSVPFDDRDAVTARVLHVDVRQRRRLARAGRDADADARAVRVAVDGDGRRRIGRERRQIAAQLEARDVAHVGIAARRQVDADRPVLRRDGHVRRHDDRQRLGRVERHRLAALPDDDDLRARRRAKPPTDLQRVRDRAEAAARDRDAADACRCRSRSRRRRSSDRRSTCSRSPPSSRCSCCSRSGRPTPRPAQSASTQQLPGVHRPPQQKSPALAAQGPLVLQDGADAFAALRLARRRVADRRRAVGRVGLALRVGRARAAGVRVLRAAHGSRSARPVQSPLVPWQLPGWQMPWKQMWPAPYAGSATHCASVEQPPQVLARGDAAQLAGRAVARSIRGSRRRRSRREMQTVDAP